MFPKLRALALSAWQGLKTLWIRFPIITLVTLTATVAGIITTINYYGAVYGDATVQDVASKILLVLSLGGPYLLLLALACENKNFKSRVSLELQALGLIILALYYYFLPGRLSDLSYIQSVTTGLLTAAGYVALVVFSAYKQSSESLWLYVATLVKQAVLSALYAFTVWAGLSLALTATHYLFDLQFEVGTWVLRIWMVSVGVVGAWIFLGNYPTLQQPTPADIQMGKFIRGLLQYVLMPLLGIFFIILYSYLIKIVVTWNWPKGGVAYWILGFSGAGMVFYAVSYPLLNRPEFTWLAKVFKAFFVLLLPLVVVLWVAVGFRLRAYGITEQRYGVFMGGLWLGIVGVYYLVSSKKTLSFMAYVLLVMVVVSLFGPQSMFNMSLRSQTNRLRTILEKNNLMVNDVVQKAAPETKLSFQDAESVDSIISFLISRDRLDAVEPWFGKVLAGSKNEWDKQRAINELLNIQPESFPNSNYFYFSSTAAGNIQPLDVRGYDYVMNGNVYGQTAEMGTPIIFSLASSTLKIEKNGNSVSVTLDKQPNILFDTTQMLQALQKKYGLNGAEIPTTETAMEQNIGSWKIKIFFLTFNGKIDDGKMTLENASFFVLLKVK